tara:strand:- start:276 stop:659 length:384 start_codon:yes stop_codon:yes gene_type:complete
MNIVMLVVLFVNLLFKNTIIILYNMEDTNLKQIETFLSTYENTLKNIFITAEKQHGKGILIVDINNNNKGNCDTQYIPLTNRDNFWEQSEDMLQVKNKIEITQEKTIFLCLINNQTTIIIDRPYEIN